MTQRKFPNWIKAYVDHTQHLESPDAFHFWTAVSVIAGALRRRCWIDMGYFEWVPNFYIIFVAPPGIVSKSTTINVGMSILKRVGGIHFGPNAMTWQALIQSLAGSTESVLMPDELWHPMSCITIAASEMGTLINPRDREMIDVLVDLWDGKKDVWTKITKTSGNDAIENPWINMIACTTPAWLADNVPESVIGGGFTSRCVFVWGDAKRRFVPYPADELPPTFKDTEEKLLHDLEIIAQMAGPFVLTPEAKQWGTDWYHAFHSKVPDALKGERLGGYVARKQTHIHKLAMIVSAAETSARLITAEHLKTALILLESVEGNFNRIFNSIGQSDSGRLTMAVLAVIRSMGHVTKQRLTSELVRTHGANDISGAIATLATAGNISVKQHNNDFVFLYNHG